MDEEEELENTLIGQQEEAPAMDTGDALMGKPSFLPYADDVAPSRVNALSVFTPGGDLKPGIDVNAITPAPTTLPAPSDVSTALNQEVPVGLPSVQDSFDRSAVRSGRSRAGEGGQDALGDFLSSFEFQGRRGRRTGDSSVVQTPSTLPPVTAQSFFGQAPASNAAEAAQRLIDAGPAFTQGQAPALDPTSDEAILARRAERESQFDPRGPNAPMGQDATRARLGGMTLNEYLNAPAGTPGVSGLRTDPQGRMISSPAPATVNNFAPQVAGGGNAVGFPILESNPVPMPGTRPGDRNPFQSDPGFIQQPSLRDPDAGFSPRPPSLRDPDEGFTPRPLPNDPASTRPGDVRDMLYRNPTPNLSDFERDSLARQISIGGTGSFAGDSAAREARIAARPDFGEAVSDRERRAARGEGLSQADARDLAQGTDPNASEGQRMRALEIQSRLGLGQFKPEKELTELEQRDLESQIRAREADIARGETKAGFSPRLIDVGGETAMELSPGYFQRIPKDTPDKTGLQATLENLQSDLDSGRLTQEEYDIATKNARDLYIGREEPKPAKPEETSGLIDMDGQDSVATETAPQAPVRVNSQAEYDALAVGTPYIDSQGTPGIKK